MATIYLAGGLKTDWQDKVIESLPQHQFIDPRSHHLTDERQYTAWDIAGIEASSILLAYFEEGNPSGYGLAFEVGYAAGCGKHIVYVDEKGNRVPEVHPWLGMLRASADVHVDTLGEALAYLKAYW